MYNEIGRVATTVRQDADCISVVYHSTEVFYYNKINDSITLNTGGWNTPTTKRRINQALFHFGFRGYYVFQKNYQWYLSTPDKDIPFNTSITLNV